MELSLAVPEPPVFGQALLKARQAEFAQVEARIRVNEARYLRLEALRDRIQDLLSQNGGNGSLIELKALPGEAPRLWLDLVSSMVMEPDPSSYRIEKIEAQGLTTLAETRDPEVALQQALQVVAHGAVTRAQMPGSTAVGDSGARTYDLAALVYSWSMGVIVGAAALLLAGMYLGKIGF
jgi:hypothetical protein